MDSRRWIGWTCLIVGSLFAVAIILAATFTGPVTTPTVLFHVAAALLLWSTGTIVLRRRRTP